MRARGVQPTAITYNAAISACARGPGGAFLDRALDLLDEMRDRDGLAPDVVSYNAAITACAQAHAPDTALWLLEHEMPRRSIRPDVISFAAAISACGAAGRWEDAVAVFETMHCAGVDPDVVAYNAAIEACELAGAHAPAQHLLAQAADRGLYARNFLVGGAHGTSNGWTKLDLHELSAPVARTAVRWALRSAGVVVDDKAEEDLVVVTGRGVHSEGGEPVLKPAILAMLRDEFDGVVECREERSNPGELRVVRLLL